MGRLCAAGLRPWLDGDSVFVLSELDAEVFPASAFERRLEQAAPAAGDVVLRLTTMPSPPPAASQLRFRGPRNDELIDEELAVGDGLSEGAVARQVVESLPSGGLLAVGNSLPVREVDVFARGGRAELLVASQRGASGIDGVTSGALGAAVAAGRPAALLTGDIAFLHDLSGLWTARHVASPFALVVVQNRGGRIFEMLPLADHPAAERSFSPGISSCRHYDL